MAPASASTSVAALLYVLVLSVTSTLYPTPAFAQPEPSEFQVTPPGDAELTDLRFASNRVGDFVVAWVQADDFFARVYTGATASLGPVLALPWPPSPVEVHYLPSITGLALGPDRRIVLGRPTSHLGGLSYHAALRIFDVMGTPTSEALDILGGTDGTSILGLHLDARGAFLVFYTYATFVGGMYHGIGGSRYDAAGNSSSGGFSIDDTFGGGVSMNRSGDVVVAWRNIRPNDALRARTYSSDGQPGTEIVVEENADALAGWGVRLDDDGSFTFIRRWKDSPRAYVGQRHAPDGTPVGERFTFDGIYGRLIAREASGFIVVGLDTSDGPSQRIMVRRFDDFGRPRSPAFQANVDVRRDKGPFGIAPFDDGSFAVAWIEEGTDSPRRDVFARVFDASTAVRPATWSSVKAQFR